MRQIIGIALMVPYALMLLYLFAESLRVLGESMDPSQRWVAAIFCTAAVMFVAGAFVIAS